MSGLTREWVFSIVGSLALLLFLGLSLVWLNIERVEMAYEFTRLQKSISAQEALIDKLEVERNTLLSPARLRLASEALGLGPAGPGQIRSVKDEITFVRARETRSDIGPAD